MKLLSISYLIILLISCRNTVINDTPIDIYRITKVYPSCADYFVLYNHEGKSDSCLINSIVDFNQQTMNIDSLFHNEYYVKRFYKQDRDLTKDFDDEGDLDAIRDYADRVFVHIAWWTYQNEFSDTLFRVYYYINKQEFPSKVFKWKTGEEVDSLLLNPIPRR